jgi:hypothetical protein
MFIIWVCVLSVNVRAISSNYITYQSLTALFRMTPPWQANIKDRLQVKPREELKGWLYSSHSVSSILCLV